MTPAPRLLLAVAAGGALGSVLRHGLGTWLPDGGGFPATTFAVNVVGCALLALLPALGRVRRSPLLTAAVGPGVLGGFTTMSAYAEQSRGLLADDPGWLAAAYVLGTVAACLAAVAAVRVVVPAAPPVPA